MLTREDNETLTRVGRGTPMGELLRQYWVPAALSSEIVAGAPLRVRLLAEDLVAFRTAEGLGLLAEACPHRLASLYYARAEDDGLRCVYHGWKFDAAGRCVDMPNEPADCQFATKVTTTAYPCVERAGVVWAYLGPRAVPPELPELEWLSRGGEAPFFFRSLRHCNWVQALEGDIDSSHLNWLHATGNPVNPSTVPGKDMPGHWARQARMVQTDRSPRLEVADTAGGVLYSARREADAGHDYHRVHPFLFPFFTMIGGGVETSEVSFNGKAWVPMDDERTLILEWQHRPGKPWTESERADLAAIRNPWGYLPATAEAGSAWRLRANRSNDYFRDRSPEAAGLFFGILSNPLQDTAIQESMGPIVDRTQEHLGPADLMIIRVRKRLLEAARALRDRGVVPPGVDEPALYRIRPVGAVLPKGADWVEATRGRRELWEPKGS